MMKPIWNFVNPLDCPTAINNDCLTGYVTSIGGREKCYDGGNFVGEGEASKWYALQHRAFTQGTVDKSLFNQRCLSEAWTYRVYSNPSRRQLHRYGASETQHPSFRCAICRPSGESDQCCRGRNGDDRCTSAHEWKCLADASVCANQVNVDDVLPFGDFLYTYEARTLDAGIIDETTQARNLGEGGFQSTFRYSTPAMGLMGSIGSKL